MMTIGSWAVVCFIALCGLAAAGLIVLFGLESNKKLSAIHICSVIAALLVTVAICGAYIWYRNNSERGRRALRDQESNLNGGIERTVSVYDIYGNLIKEYSGKFDIESDRKSYILFDDDNGKRHMIYYTTGTIIIDER